MAAPFSGPRPLAHHPCLQSRSPCTLQSTTRAAMRASACRIWLWVDASACTRGSLARVLLFICLGVRKEGLMHAYANMALHSLGAQKRDWCMLSLRPASTACARAWGGGKQLGCCCCETACQQRNAPRHPRLKCACCMRYAAISPFYSPHPPYGPLLLQVQFFPVVPPSPPSSTPSSPYSPLPPSPGGSKVSSPQLWGTVGLLVATACLHWQ